MNIDNINSDWIKARIKEIIADPAFDETLSKEAISILAIELKKEIDNAAYWGNFNNEPVI